MRVYVLMVCRLGLILLGRLLILLLLFGWWGESSKLCIIVDVVYLGRDLSIVINVFVYFWVGKLSIGCVMFNLEYRRYISFECDVSCRVGVLEFLDVFGVVLWFL